MQFIPDKDEGPTLTVPYFDEARKEDGWQGQGTTRSYDSLKSALTNAIARLDGVVHSIQRGTYSIGGIERTGAQISYSIAGPGGQMIYGRLDIAALPVREPKRTSRYQEVMRNRLDKAMAMALYNVTEALKAQWVLKQMNPSYVPLMPWLLAKPDKTLSESYIEAGIGLALPAPEGEPPDHDVVEGDFRPAED